MVAFDPEEFFSGQLKEWDVCRERYAQLGYARRKSLIIEGREYILIHNPLRAVSASAKVENGAVARPCFLCRSSRPAQQRDFIVAPDGSTHRYRIAINPYPILTRHFTIISDSHSRQEITPERLRDMAFLARQMSGYLLFFNGAMAGASAPDHFHFQAVRQEDVPLLNWDSGATETLFIQTCGAENVKTDFAGSDMTNILCWYKDGKTHWLTVRRRRHRPQQYYAEGNERVLISPASLEFAGIIPLAREEDFMKMDAALLADIFRQCYDKEPIIDVGLCKDNVSAVRNADGTTTVKDVPIGENFHWRQLKTFSYEGEMLHRRDESSGQTFLVNRLTAEKYLRSVITSEMAATSNLPLLKAHAVVSRSWLAGQMNRKQCNSRTEIIAPTGEITRWYDATTHKLFDVCADDHCQRYQGLPAKDSPLVDQAIEETRGEVLMYGGRVIDARFSKCCGGRTEEYSYCWENINPPYLRSVSDTRKDGSAYCNVADKAILSRVLNSYDLKTTAFFAWETAYTQTEISDIIERKQHFGLGKITRLEALERGPGGRISRLKITGEHGSVVVGKELEIRRTLSETHLYSSAFDIITSLNGNNELLFTLKGRGWGHGVGLCQIGAAVMGEEGCSYREILSYYYTGTVIERIW